MQYIQFKSTAFSIISAALLLTSCTDVIEIDLDAADAQYVIQGNVTDEPGPYTVTIHQSVPFDEPNNFPAISGAVVTINDGFMTDTLSETQVGIYQTRNLLQGVPGRQYQLTVKIGEKVFSARSVMAQPVALLDLKTDISQFGGESTIQMVPVFQDPAGVTNYYRFVQYSNRQRWPNIFVLDDRNNDGVLVSRPMFSPMSDLTLATGDTVTVEMQCIDRTTYKYFYSLDASSGNGPNATTPANPDNNFGNTVLGYFSAHSTQHKTLVLN